MRLIGRRSGRGEHAGEPLAGSGPPQDHHLARQQRPAGPHVGDGFDAALNGDTSGGASVGTDAFSGVNNVRATSFDDVLLGGNPAFNSTGIEIFDGRGGNVTAGCAGRAAHARAQRGH